MQWIKSNEMKKREIRSFSVNYLIKMTTRTTMRFMRKKLEGRKKKKWLDESAGSEWLLLCLLGPSLSLADVNQRLLSLHQPISVIDNVAISSFQNLLLNCSQTALRIFFNFLQQDLFQICSETARKLLGNCTGNFFQFFTARFAPDLLWNCSEIALKLIWRFNLIFLKWCN